MSKKTNPMNLSSEGLAEKMRQWRKEHPKATLTEIEEAVDKEWAQLRQEIVKELAQGASTEEEALLKCPQCSELMVKNGKKKRKLTMKGGKQVTIERQQMRCLGCGMTLFPPG